MGSTSDLPIMEQAAKLLDEFEIPFEINALSAHRTPQQAMDFAKNAADRASRSSLQVLVEQHIFLVLWLPLRHFR